MSTKDFFDETSDQSAIKTAIVSKYFWAWAKIIISNLKRRGGSKLAYIDLFSGPGRYKDGTMSTPLLILRQAIDDPEMRDMLVTVFNDKDSANTKSLEQAISELEGIDKLRHKPIVRNQEVGSEIVKAFEGMRFVPTLFFVDPWGYKGLSLRLVNSVLKDWGCDCIFFFNYNRISMGLGNELVSEHMNALFGQDRAKSLRPALEGLSPHRRETLIVEELTKALQAMGANFVLPFCFKNDSGSRTSHHLIFATKDFLAYDVMKDIMARESSSAEQGVATFQYCPAETRQGILFELSRPLDDLRGMLAKEFSGQTLSFREVYRRHSVGRRFIKRNYKQTLLQMEAEDCVRMGKHRKGMFSDDIQITFL